MRIFITGATGYIGGAIAKKLKTQGHDIIALVRNKNSLEKAMRLGYETIVGDMLDPSDWIMQVKNVEVIIHCAQISMQKRISNSWVRKAEQSDLKVLSALFEAAKRNRKLRLLIYTSGISVSGDNGDKWIDENSTPVASVTVGSYHLAGEGLAKKAVNDGLPVVIIRPSLPVSEGGTFLHFFLKKAMEGKLQFVGDGRNYMPTVHINDLADAYALVVEKQPIGETFIISDDEPLTSADFTNILLSEFGQEEKRRGVPKWIVSLFAGKPLATLLSSSFRVKNDKAKLLLGWKPQHSTLRDSLKHIMRHTH